MIKDEFNRLMKLFHQGAEGKQINLQELFSESMAFFEKLKEEFAQGTPEDRRDALKMMSEMHKEVIAESQKIIKNSGMSEEQLFAFAENPSNFTPEQWQDFQKSKSQIHAAGMELVDSVKKLILPPDKQPHKLHSVQPIEEHPSSDEAKKKKPKKSPSKTGWLKT
jgi:hypothetical protein